MKKNFLKALSLTLALMLCAMGMSTALASDAKKVAGIAMPGMDTDWYFETEASVRAMLEARGYDVVTTSANASAQQQITDIENLTAKGAVFIFSGTVDSSATADAMNKARSEGVFVFDWMNNEEIAAYDTTLSTDEYKNGEATAKMASEWIDERYPDAADGSIDVLLVELRMNEPNARRDDGLETIAENAKVNVVDKYDFPLDQLSDEKITEYFEAAFQLYPNLKVIIAHDSAFAINANEVVTRLSGYNYDELGFFATGTSQLAYTTLKESADNSSVLRGLVNIGEYVDACEVALDIFESGTLNEENRMIILDPTMITLDNVDQYIK